MELNTSANEEVLWSASWSCVSRRVTRRLAHDQDAGHNRTYIVHK